MTLVRFAYYFQGFFFTIRILEILVIIFNITSLFDYIPMNLLFNSFTLFFMYVYVFQYLGIILAGIYFIGKKQLYQIEFNRLTYYFAVSLIISIFTLIGTYYQLTAVANINYPQNIFLLLSSIGFFLSILRVILAFLLPSSLGSVKSSILAMEVFFILRTFFSIFLGVTAGIGNVSITAFGIINVISSTISLGLGLIMLYFLNKFVSQFQMDIYYTQ